MFKTGDKVVCINTGANQELVYGEVYTISKWSWTYNPITGNKDRQFVNLFEHPLAGFYGDRFQALDKSLKESKLVRMLDETGYDWHRQYEQDVRRERRYLPLWEDLPKGVLPKVKQFLAEKYELNVSIANTIDDFMRKPFP